MNTLLNYGREAKLGQLNACGCIEDLLRGKITLRVDAQGNADLLARKKPIAGNHDIEFFHYPQLCLFNREKYISQGVPMTLPF